MRIEANPTVEPTIDILDAAMHSGELSVRTANRDAALLELLGVDYEFAHQSGLFNDFYFNPGTGEDGVMHILSGDFFTTKDGAIIPRGFHHEPSGEPTWGTNEKGVPLTYVDESHLPTKARDRKHFKQYPYNPYKAYVVINGHIKRTIDIDPNTGEDIVVETKNGMFPREYDALAVLRTIKMARDGRDTSKDQVDTNKGIIIAKVDVPLLDGGSTMEIRLILDAASKKIKSAFPVVNKGKHMIVSREEIKAHLGL